MKSRIRSIAHCLVPILSSPFRRTATLALIIGTLSINHQAAEVVGSIRAELYGDGQTIPQVKAGTARPTALEYATSVDFPETGVNFTRRVVGYFIPPTTGNYVFFITSDDNSELWLSTDSSPANKRLIAQETGWSNAYQWTASAGGSDINQKRSDRWSPAGGTDDPYASGIPLTSGQRYFLEVYHQEGGGGDNVAVYFKRVGDPDPADGDVSNLTGPVIAMDVASTFVFLSQPVSRRAAPGQTITFAALADSPTATYEWLRNGAVIAGETGTTYTTAALTAADNNATFAVRATDGTRVITTTNAVLTVGQLVPIANSLQWEFWGEDAITRPEVEDPSFATPPETAGTLPTFETPTNYSDEYVARVTGLFVPPTTGNYVFFIAADDTGDLFLSTDATAANKRLIAQEVGWSGSRNWTGIGGTGGGLTDAQAISQKRSDGFLPDPVGDPTATPPFTNGIPLVAGQSYFIQAVMEEGGGGDNLAVTWKLVGEADPVNGSAPRIDSSQLATYSGAVGLNGATITITNNLTNVTVLQNRSTTLNVAAISGYQGDASGAGPALTYQWQTAPSGSTTFTNIPGATGTSFTTPLLGTADQGRQYRVVIRGGDATANTAVSTVTVTPDTAAPAPVTVGSVNAARNVVTLSFNELLNQTSAQTAANYVFNPGNITASSVVLANGTNLTITTSGPLSPNVTNTLTITGTQDLAGNPVAANTTIQFIFNPVTYSANILFDQPVAYFRFEETSGTVATNSGTSGIQGAYFEGDETTVGEGGTPRTPTNVPGPRPGDFAGFEANNLAGDFDGVDDWVDARSQYLQGVGAFTLEYWVRPNRTNEFEEVWPARVALVGQNDAVEYGFINPTTIQIWTAGGGSLDTPYNAPTATGAGTVPIPDDTWHHVATIGDGTSIRTYFDGVLVGTGGSATANYGSSTFNVHIGGGGGFDATGNWFRGQMDEVAIFNKAIPADRVRAHYLAGKEGGVITVSGPVTPSQPTGDTTASISRNGQSVTISATPAGGTVEATDSLATPNWQAVGPAPQTVPANGNARFFRIRR